jgi:AcrR family transcriptional regulator
LLDVAARIFCERGYMAATLEEIGDAMNMTRAAVYHYGMGKEAILAACNAQAIAVLDAAIQTAEKETSGLGELISYFRQYVTLNHTYIVACFILTDRRHMGEVVGEKDRQNQRRLGAAVQAMIERGIADGSIRACSPKAVSRTLYAAFNGLLFPFRPGSQENLTAVADSILAIFIEGLRPPDGVA